VAGLTISLVNAYSVLLKFAKLWELQQGTGNSQLPTAKRDAAVEAREESGSSS